MGVALKTAVMRARVGDCLLRRAYSVRVDRNYCSVQNQTNASSWGNPDNGRLGCEGSLPGTAVPRATSALNDFVIQVACGGAHTLWLTKEGEVYSAGSGDHGQLGHGDRKERKRPQRIEGIENALSIAAGNFHSVVITAEGMFSFGRNNHGQLGLGHTSDVGTPEAVVDWYGFESGVFRGVACGGEHTLALTGDADRCVMWSWGLGNAGQLGIGEHQLSDQLEPCMIYDDSGRYLTQVSAGIHSSAAVTADGELLTWGDGHSGQNGHGHWFDQAEPTKVDALHTRVADVSCGGMHTTILDDFGEVYTMGLNDHGQLGLGFDQATCFLPKRVENLENIVTIASGWKHTLALAADGCTVYAWGHGLCGQLGVGHACDL